MGLGLEHGLPEHFFLGHPKDTKGIDTHQYGQLFDGNRNTIDKVIKIPELAMELPFVEDALDDQTFQTPKLSQSQIDMLPIDDIDMVTAVDTGRMDDSAPHLGLVYIEFGIVEPSPVVEHGHHKLQGEVAFEIKALIAFHGIGSGMPLGKGIARKTL